MGARILNRVLSNRYMDEINLSELLKPKKFSSNSIISSI
jgi:hypothetical protein